MKQIPEPVWQSQVRSRRNPELHAFGDAVEQQPTLLIFLRHFG